MSSKGSRLIQNTPLPEEENGRVVETRPPFKGVPETRAKLISTLRQVRSERAAYHVISSRGDWVVIGEGTAKARKRFEDQGRAIEHARDLAQRSHSDLFVHSRDGRVREQMSFRDSGTQGSSTVK
jgi:hypothetical protein